MRKTPSDTNALLLCGLDGANPIGFLAALGTFRVLALSAKSDSVPVWLAEGVRMSWTNRHGMGWRPLLHCHPVPSEDQLLETLYTQLALINNSSRFSVSDDNLKLTPEQFRSDLDQACTMDDREQLECMAALACSLPPDKKGYIQKSLLQMVNGGKRQNYLEIIRTLGFSCNCDHLRKTLFAPWQYHDPAKKLNLRWDPIDDRLYALRWDDPSNSKTRSTGSMIGANRLAVEALPLFATVPSGTTVRTVGFVEKDKSVSWYWPMWRVPIGIDVCKSTLARPDIVDNQSNAVQRTAIGIAAVLCCQRRVVDQYQTASFTPSQPI